MGARRPKPTALKEQASVQQKLGLSRLFAAANALVPFPKPHLDVVERAQNPAKDSALDAKELPQPEEEKSEYGTAIIVPNQKRSPSSVGLDATNPQIVPNRTSVTQLKRAENLKVPAAKRDSRYLSLLFLVPAIGLASYAYFSHLFTAPPEPIPRKSALTPEQIEERVAFYRQLTGTKLNRDRINVQIENFKKAPDLTPGDHRVKPPNMMEGLPLKGEAMNFSRNPGGDLPADPTYSEAKIGYGLQEEQDRIEFEKRARQAWINEFIENARKDGYDVKIDAQGNVKAKPISKGE